VTSALAKGDAFRDLVDQVLSAAGFRTDPEARVKFKKVDNRALWTLDDLQGPVRYLFETKDYNGTLPKTECVEFVSEYGSLVKSRDTDHAWLISKGPISPDGKALIENEPGLYCMTFLEFQRRLLVLDGYLNDLISERDASHLPKFYIRPETTDGEDLETKVRAWINEVGAAPLFILGPYGKGKSTFANHLAAQLASEALIDPTRRAPILVRLGEIVDEQSLDGLIGKVLASRYRVPRYHFETFKQLNRLGRFLVIYDGFDEMKHGMTFTRFQQTLNELMRADEGEARVLVLGRDTALHDDLEFRAIIGGRQITAAGREVPDPNRRPYRTLQIRGFTVSEAHEYVRRYFPIRVAEIFKQRGVKLENSWLYFRINDLLSGRFDALLERPVHAQMLCEIAAYPESSLQNLTVYELFDTFVHYLLGRETQKKGRDASFDLGVRRVFNAALAWWLWERGGASTTTLSDVPLQLCREAAADVTHDLDDTSLKRELIQGCLIEKAANTIYFGHRSLQEFLVADHLIETDLLERVKGRQASLEQIIRNLTPEVVEFIVAGVQTSESRRASALQWFSRLVGFRANDVPFQGFELFVQLAQALVVQIQDPGVSPWWVWLSYFQRSGTRDFALRTRNSVNVLADLFSVVRGKGEEVQASATYALSRVFQHVPLAEASSMSLPIAAMIDVAALKAAILLVRGNRSSRHIIERKQNFLLWSFLRSTTIDTSGDLSIEINTRKILDDAQKTLRLGFADDAEDFPPIIKFSVQALYQSLSRLGVSDRDIDAIRPYFTEPATRKSITPLEITVVGKTTSQVKVKLAVNAKAGTNTLSFKPPSSE